MLARDRGRQEARHVEAGLLGNQRAIDERPVRALAERVVELLERALHAILAVVVAGEREQQGAAAELEGEVLQVVRRGARRLPGVEPLVDLRVDAKAVVPRRRGHELPQPDGARVAAGRRHVAALDQREVVEQGGHARGLELAAQHGNDGPPALERALEHAVLDAHATRDLRREAARVAVRVLAELAEHDADPLVDAAVEAGRIDGAVLIPLPELRDRWNEVEKLPHPVVSVCRSGVRATMAMMTARHADDNDWLLLEGGMQAWMNKGMPMVSDTGKAPDVITSKFATGGSCAAGGGSCSVVG